MSNKARSSLPSLRSAGRRLLSIHLFIACCAVLLCLGAEKTFLGLVPPLLSPLHGLLLANTLVAYNIHALVNGPWVTGEALSSRGKRLHAGVAIAAAMASLALLPAVSPKLWIGLAVLGIITAAYSTPLLPFRYKQRLKDFGALKLAVLVGTWVLSTTWLPALKWDIPLAVFWPELVIRTLLLLALCIAFDIRDVDTDRAVGINTLPVRIGERAAYKVTYTTLVLCALFAVVAPVTDWSTASAACIACGYAGWAIERSRRRPSDVAYLIGIDGALAVYAIAVLLL